MDFVFNKAVDEKFKAFQKGFMKVTTPLTGSMHLKTAKKCFFIDTILEMILEKSQALEFQGNLPKVGCATP